MGDLLPESSTVWRAQHNVLGNSFIRSSFIHFFSQLARIGDLLCAGHFPKHWIDIKCRTEQNVAGAQELEVQ